MPDLKDPGNMDMGPDTAASNSVEFQNDIHISEKPEDTYRKSNEDFLSDENGKRYAPKQDLKFQDTAPRCEEKSPKFDTPLQPSVPASVEEKTTSNTEEESKAEQNQSEQARENVSKRRESENDNDKWYNRSTNGPRDDTMYIQDSIDNDMNSESKDCKASKPSISKQLPPREKTPGLAETLEEEDEQDSKAESQEIEPEAQEDEQDEWLSWEKAPQSRPKIAEVKWHTSFESWKNRFSENEGFEIIEVLSVNQNSIQEVAEEAQRRAGTWRKRKPSKVESKLQGQETWIQRIRIQSPSILYFLSKNSGHKLEWSKDVPRTFFRPFRAFYYLQTRMKNSLRNFMAFGKIPGEPEEDEDEDEDEDEELIAGDPMKFEYRGSMDNKQFTQDTGEIGEVPTIIKHIRCYIQFVEKHIMPMYEKYGQISQRRVRYHDLWMSFQPGEIIYAPPSSEPSTSRSNAYSEVSSNFQTAWRLWDMEYSLPEGGSPDMLEEGERGRLILSSYHIDFDGSSYGPVQRVFEIPAFEGEKEITTLSVYPMRFAKDADGKRKDLETQGERFQTHVKDKHMFYEGWTFTHPPDEGTFGEAFGEQKYPEHIEGDVIVDFVEGFRANPSLKPTFTSIGKFDDRYWPCGYDIPINHWSDASRTKFLRETPERLQLGEFFEAYLERYHRKTNKFIKQWESGDGDVTQLEEDDLILLPHRMMVYALRERRFVMVDIRYLRPPVTQGNVFRDLKIDKNHKRMVKSLVKAHFKRQDDQKRKPGSVYPNQDLIQGKGSGLVVLLHGVPGVGKTATAETVAQANKRPLFVITCGDLGFTPNEVENALRNIFRLAHLWECILLLDEADIFLSRRELGDLKRNALVSVFLRVLEYYRGILFLTTNRVGTLDEAFKSRIHVSLYYPPLTSKQTLAIFELNIKKLQAIEAEKQKRLAESGHSRPVLVVDIDSIMDFANYHYRTSNQPWNGRQIRNAFQIASSLADFDMEKSSLEEWDEEPATQGEDQDGTTAPATASILSYNQFNIVAKAIAEFESYLTAANANMNDEDAARNCGIRADDYIPPSRAEYYPARPTQTSSYYQRGPDRTFDYHDSPIPYGSGSGLGSRGRGGHRGHGPPPHIPQSGNDQFQQSRQSYRPDPQRSSRSPARGPARVPSRGSPQPPREHRAYGGNQTRRPRTPRRDEVPYSDLPQAERYPPEGTDQRIHATRYEDVPDEREYEEEGYDTRY